MSWSRWGLEPLDDYASGRAVLAGGEVFTLAVGGYRTTVEQLSERWSVCAVDLTPGSPPPRPGDLVIWRDAVADDPKCSFTVTSPMRVLFVRAPAGPEALEVYCLHDGSLDGLVDDTSRRKLNALARRDRVLRPAQEWELLSLWRLYPECGRCGGDSRAVVYGFPAWDFTGGDRPDLAVGGCLMPADPADYQCSRCGHEFSVATQQLSMSSVRHQDLHTFQFS